MNTNNPASSNDSAKIKTLIAQRIGGQKFDANEAQLVFSTLMEGELSQAQIAALLIAMSITGETETELCAIAKATRERCIKITAPRNAMDIVGTGGDKSGTFNISSVTALVVRAAGVAVAKHGNRAASSQSGSANLFAALGIPIDMTPDDAQKNLDQQSFAFLMAPVFHPAMRHVGPVRQQLGVRTVFNLVGPLVNPASVERYLAGVFDSAWLNAYARILRDLGARNAWIVHGNEDGLDEISLCGSTSIVELGEDGNIRNFTLTPEEVGLRRRSLDELRGGSPEHNAEITHQIMSGTKGAKRDAVLINSAAAFMVAQQVTSMQDGISLAEQTIDSGRAASFLTDYVSNIAH